VRKEIIYPLDQVTKMVLVVDLCAKMKFSKILSLLNFPQAGKGQELFSQALEIFPHLSINIFDLILLRVKPLIGPASERNVGFFRYAVNTSGISHVTAFVLVVERVLGRKSDSLVKLSIFEYEQKEGMLLTRLPRSSF
jgi:hypothetical protein